MERYSEVPLIRPSVVLVESGLNSELGTGLINETHLL